MASSIAATLGLAAASPSYGAHYLIFHFLFAYAVLSSRIMKGRLRIDHQVSPREDVAKYGQAAVAKGRITQRQLDMVKRLESCHANSMEHFSLFAAAIVFAHVAGVPNEVVNSTGLAYTVVRAAYAANYVLAETYKWARLRGLLWWASNFICLRLMWKAGKAYNGGP
ncbi:hypothetical protein K431DRAFT_346895 [Polychaeton citri CBS 116435]|uniref:Membrane-associated, eicosanoid/glutathione metabolism (MAPEG) protein n=1 Tax=Polychaeton citri CBS 116435 TaxID=1314669 RepID=A0A9P4UNK4_9PEZI|nr:hypothetical protein K431DRAFT_346895 [Polychaeton citri CBS 116435]